MAMNFGIEIESPCEMVVSALVGNEIFCDLCFMGYSDCEKRVVDWRCSEISTYREDNQFI